MPLLLYSSIFIVCTIFKGFRLLGLSNIYVCGNKGSTACFLRAYLLSSLGAAGGDMLCSSTRHLTWFFSGLNLACTSSADCTVVFKGSLLCWCWRCSWLSRSWYPSCYLRSASRCSSASMRLNTFLRHSSAWSLWVSFLSMNLLRTCSKVSISFLSRYFSSISYVSAYPSTFIKRLSRSSGYFFYKNSTYLSISLALLSFFTSNSVRSSSSAESINSLDFSFSSTR